MESLYKKTAIIYYLVKTLKRDYPAHQIGKTVVQKLIYLLTREDLADFSYSMHHYGPYSQEVSNELEFAENIGALTIDFDPEKGYFIEPEENFNLEKHLNKNEKKKIEEIVDKYGNFNAVELSIIATALYIRDNFGVKDSDLVRVVSNLKSQYSKERIEKILSDAGIV